MSSETDDLVELNQSDAGQQDCERNSFYVNESESGTRNLDHYQDYAPQHPCLDSTGFIPTHSQMDRRESMDSMGTPFQTDGSENSQLNVDPLDIMAQHQVQHEIEKADENENRIENGEVRQQQLIKGQSSIDMSNTKTRARNRKSFEPTPFLSIDNLPANKRQTSPADNATRKHKPKPVPRVPRVPLNTPAPGNGEGEPLSRGENNPVGQRPVSNGNRNSARSPPQRGVATTSKERPVNHHVKQPFKHSVRQPVSQSVAIQPDQDMKEKTAAATNRVAMSLAGQKADQEKRVQGRLLKGKLKPLYPVKADGPSINHCRGIVSETQAYEASPSRTLQRRRQLLTGLAQGYKGERPQTAESIHHTSVASDTTDAADQDIEGDLAAADMRDNCEEEELAMETNGQLISGNGAAYVSRAAGPGDESDRTVLSQRFVQELMDGGAPPAGQRPYSVHDSRGKKEVRFADEDEIADLDGRRRTRSAMPRLIQGVTLGQGQSQCQGQSGQEVKERRPKGSPPNGGASCKAEDFALHRRDGDDEDRDDHGESGGNLRGSRRGVPPGNGGRCHVTGGNSFGTCANSGGGWRPQSGGSENRTSRDFAHAPQEELRLSISDLHFSSDLAPPSSQRPLSSAGYRPKVQLKSWDDVRKPDRAFDDLAVFGKARELESHPERPSLQYPWLRQNSREETSASATLLKGRRRPQSAKASLEVQKSARAGVGQGLTVRRRPWSAKASLASTPNTTRSSLPDKAVTRANLEGRTSLTHGRARVEGRTRPTSAKSQRPSSGRARKVVDATGKGQSSMTNGGITGPQQPLSGKVGIPGGQTQQNTMSSAECCYCGTLTSRKIDFNNGEFFNICHICREQTASAPQRKEQRSGETIDNDGDASGRPASLVCTRDQVPAANGAQTSLNVSVEHLCSEAVHGAMTELEAMEAERRLNAGKRRKESNARCPSEASDGENGQRSDGGKDNILTNLDDIERSLEEVQKEIRDCINRKKETENGSLDSVNSDHIEKGVLGSEAPKGELSSHLIGDEKHQWTSPVSYNMTVYQFNESKQNDSVTNQEPLDDTDGMPGDGATEPSEISTYDVMMMQQGGPLQEQFVKQQTTFYKQLGKELPGSHQDADDSSAKDSAGSLEVVATSKALTYSRPDEEPVGPVAPSAPLCFQVNARPPSGHLYYFAYGMDMNPNRMESYIKRDVSDRFWGLLFGFKLLFNKKGLDQMENQHRGQEPPEKHLGFPNVELCSGSSVEGCLYLITPEELQQLDNCVGYQEYFEHVVLPVWLLNCNEPDELGVAQYCVPAVLYIAKDKWIHQGAQSAVDGSYAADQCLKGADLLSIEYKEQLKEVVKETTDDETEV